MYSVIRKLIALKTANSQKLRAATTFALSAAMVFGSLPTGAIAAFAEDGVPSAKITERGGVLTEGVPEEEAASGVSQEVAEQGTPDGGAQTDASGEVDEPETVDEEIPAPALQEGAEPEILPEDDALASAPEREDHEQTSLTYEDDTLLVTVEAAPGVLPAGATIEAEEILPVTTEKADAYGEALSSLAETLREDDKVYRDAKVFDIRIMDADGIETEPNGEVKVAISYKTALPMPDVAPEQVELAHLDNEGSLSVLPADVTTDEAGAVESAEFTTDSFSYYILFGTQEGSESEPVNVGEYGWLKFSTPDDEEQWGHYEGEGMLPATNTEEGYHRILQVKLHTLKPGGTATSYDDANYNFVTTNEYFWTWENSIVISDFYVPGYEVVETKMHTAWADPADDVWQDSLIGRYSVRGYRSSDGTSSDLNVLDVYMKSVPTPENAMRYVVRYVHADGSVTDDNVRYLSSGSVTLDVDKPRTGERFSGIAVAVGAEAVEANTTTKSVKFTYDPKVNLAKAYVYFEANPEANTTQDKGRFDKVKVGSDFKYYNAKKGLYTEKNAVCVGDREFLVNLEAWYVDNAASVGMVLDASGSMAWTAGVPTPYELTAEQVASIDTTKNSSANPLTAADVNKLLDVAECDNSNNGYNGYKYFVYTKTVTNTNPIDEYAALGYTYSNITGNTDGVIDLGNPAKGKAYIKHANGPGWYFVNSATDKANYESYGAKRFEGLLDSGGGPCKFWVKQEGGKYYLYCRFSQGSTADSSHSGTSVQESMVYVKRDQMMTKAETLQDSIAQFGAILNSASPLSEMAMTRFSHRNFSERLELLNWTNKSEDIASALDLVPNAAGGVTKSDGTYQYGITGGTVSYQGFNVFLNSYKPTADANNYKYIILFTDGKDQGPNETGNGITVNNATTNNYSTTNYTKRINLDTDFAGYTIITMFMRSVGMSDQDVTDSRAFLQNLASGGKDGDPNKKLYYEANSDNPHEIVDSFREIAMHIVTGLQNYSIRDYIDPRFDVVNEAGQVLSVLDSEGQFRHLTNPDVDATTGFRGFTTPDGKQAQLGYDSERKLFYVLWQGQDIQASAVGSSSVEDATVTPWKSQIRLTAKEDFLGGNDILTNGSELNENLVYKPIMKTAQGTDQDGNPITILVPDYDDFGREQVDETQLSKAFPYASVNPGVLDVAVGNYEDTIFLGEDITPGDLLSVMLGEGQTTPVRDRIDQWNLRHRVADTVYDTALMAELGDTDQSSVWYVEYLERLGHKNHGSKDYYGTLLRHVKLTGAGSVSEILAAFEGNSDYTVTSASGTITIVGKANTPAAGETITIVKHGTNASIKLELPYYYLASPTDSTIYAGRDRTGVIDPQDDRVGTMTYEWKVVDFDSNLPARDARDEGNDFVKFGTYVNEDTHMDTTKPVQYQFSMKYQPAAIDDAKDEGDNGSTRTRALTGKDDEATALIRDAVGDIITEPKQTSDEMGWAVIHAVDGRILVEKRIPQSVYEVAKKNNPDATMTLRLVGQRDRLDDEGNPIKDDNNNVLKNIAWEKELKVEELVPVRMETVDGATYVVVLSEWVTGLPQDIYTIEEDITGDFVTPRYEAQDPTSFMTDSNGNVNDPAKPYDDTFAKWFAPYTVTEGAGGTPDTTISPSWYIGRVQDGKPAASSYASTTYRYGDVINAVNTVKYDLTNESETPKNVDPLLAEDHGKDYLNAQVGKAVVSNSILYMLPAAGGPGVYPFLLAGAFVAFYAISGEDGDLRRLSRRKLRRRRRVRLSSGPLGGG